MGLPRCNILGVGVHAIAMGDAVRTMEETVRAGGKGYVCVTGVHGISEAQRDPGLRGILNRALLNVPDGKPPVWVGHWYGHAAMDRVYGPDLMLEVCRVSAEKGYTHFFYGGKAGVAEELAAVLQSRFAGLRVVGTYTPPFRPLTAEESTALRAQVAAARPDFFWVGLSTPKQEHFMAEFSEQLDCRVMCGVGAAFDLHTGRMQDAPHWMKRAGLQWFHRMLQEPRRLGRRYMVNNPRFVLSILAQVAGLRRSPV